MSQAPRHSKPETKNSPSAELEPPCSASSVVAAGRLAELGQDVVGAAHPARDVVADEHAVPARSARGGRGRRSSRPTGGMPGSGPSPQRPGGCRPACTSRSGAGPPTGPGSTPSGAAGSGPSPPRSSPAARRGRPPRAARGRARRPRAHRADQRLARSTVGHQSSVGRIRSRSSLTDRSLPGSGPASPGSGSCRRCTRRRTCRAGLEVHERGVAEVDARRLRRAVGQDEAAQLAARRLDRVVGLARAARGSPR